MASTPPEGTGPPRQFELRLQSGAVLCCPAYPADCDWVAVRRDGRETHRVNAAAVTSDAAHELTRLADALSDCRRGDPSLPVTVHVVGLQAFGLESAATADSTGRTLRFASASEGPVDYLRVCDQAGHEVGYWTLQEFTDEAAEVLGALIGCLAYCASGALGMVVVYFTPQAWQNNCAIEVDPEGPRSFWIPATDAKATDGDWLSDSSCERDRLREHPLAPEWIRDWHGPFEISLEPQSDAQETPVGADALQNSTGTGPS
jgi:hypothetical protein